MREWAIHPRIAANNPINGGRYTRESLNGHALDNTCIPLIRHVSS